MIVDEPLRLRLKAIRLLVCDVDGTLTDGAMWYGPDGELLKRFHTRDGHGIAMARSAGIDIAIVTSEDSPIVTSRARKLGLEHVVLGCKDKAAAVRDLRDQLGLDRDAVAFAGDDLGDLAGFSESGVRFAVADAVEAVQAMADAICDHGGGDGAVREVIEALLSSRP